MADVASRYSSTPAMQNTSPTLLSYFNSNFTQTNSWEEFPFPQKLISLVMSSLLGERFTLESWRRLLGLVKSTGSTGSVTQPASASTHYSKLPILSSETSSSLPLLLGSGQGATASKNQITVQNVTQALLAISKTIELAGYQSPVYCSPNVYNLQVQRLVEG